jgi:cytochrome P450 PksS
MRKDGDVAEFRWWMPGWICTLAASMLTMDEPDHTRRRRSPTKPSRWRAIVEMQPGILVIARELAADLFADRGLADLVERYARKPPLSVICELLGLPRIDRLRFVAWANSVRE